MASTTIRTEQEQAQPADVATFMELVQGVLWSRCLVEIAELNVADVLDDDAQTPAELADKVGANANALGRVMRLLATRRVRGSRRPFRHTVLSRLLRTDNPRSMRGFTRMAIPTWPLLGSFGHTLRTGRPAVEAVEPGGFWEFLVKNPAFERIFDEAMTSKASADIAGILRAYDFSEFGSIADIGGGRGHLIKAVLEVVPTSKGIRSICRT